MSKRKLSNEQVARAQQLHDEGLSHQQIGDVVGASRNTVQRYLNPASRKRERKQVRKHKRERYTSNVEFREASKEYSRNYKKTHKDLYSAYRAQHQKEHPEYYNAANAVRRALTIGATVGNLAEIIEIYRKAKEVPKVRCYLCGELIPIGHRHVDHITPLTKGGAHRPSNLAVTCDVCNIHKHNKLPEEIGVLL